MFLGLNSNNDVNKLYWLSAFKLLLILAAASDRFRFYEVKVMSIWPISASTFLVRDFPMPNKCKILFLQFIVIKYF